MEERRFYTVTEALQLWEGKHPGNAPTRQTFYNWVKRFQWCLNSDRIISRQKMLIDADRFDEFNQDPYKFL